MNRLFAGLKNFPFHGLLLIIFFLADGYKDNIGLIPIKDLFLYFLFIVVASMALYISFYLALRSRTKAGILVTASLVVFLFYGSVQDFIRDRPLLNTISANHWLIPISGVLLIILFIALKRKSGSFQRLNLFINCLLLIYITLDVVIICYRSISVTNEKAEAIATNQHQSAERSGKPDIFFILLDEYSGNRVLKDYFNYDNSAFTTFLQQRGFFMPTRPISNYSMTPFSMAATFEMNYPKWIRKKSKLAARDYTVAVNQISTSNALRYLKENGYSIVNYSVFDIENQPSLYDPEFLALKLKLITHKTMLERVRKALYWGVGNFTGLNARTRIGNGNKKLVELTSEAAANESSQPRFIYTHLMMPHPPFLYDSTGRELQDNPRLDTKENQTHDYVQYTVYTNKVIGQLVDKILDKTKGKAVIILLSDHGSRETQRDNCETLNCNMNAVYLPSRDYRQYNDSISNVNQFRALFNSVFKSEFPLLKDSCVF